jgi:hypothetical protein
MPRFEVKVTRRNSKESGTEGATESTKSDSQLCIDCTICVDSIDTPELYSRDRPKRVPLSCRAAKQNRPRR